MAANRSCSKAAAAGEGVRSLLRTRASPRTNRLSRHESPVASVSAILLTNLVTNAAAAALMFPIMAGIVASLGVGWEPFVVILMLGCSYAFINPAGYQTSLMVMKPGGYSFSDFVRVGVPLTIVVGAVAVTLATILYPI